MIKTMIANMKIAIFDKEVVTISGGEFDHNELREVVDVVEDAMLRAAPSGIKQVDKMPKTGQFSAIWTYDDLPWSGTYEWTCNGLTTYDQYHDEFAESSGEVEVAFAGRDGVLFFVGSDE